MVISQKNTSKNTKKYHNAFTIVELLIVIVVIGVLAAIVGVGYSGVKNRAQAVTIANALKQTEKAFQLLAIEEGRSTWWQDNAFTGSGNPTIESVMANSNLKNYLQSVPHDVGGEWVYDNDLDTKATCGAENANGVNIFIRNVPNAALVLELDKQMDDGDLNCGKVRHYSSGTQIMYNFSYNQEM